LNTTVDYLAYGDSSKKKGDLADVLVVAEKAKPYPAGLPESAEIYYEQTLSSTFRSLNAEGQAKVAGYINDLLASGKYTYGF
jgi:hypothetical protein